MTDPTAITFTVPGVPVAKQRARTVRLPGGQITTFTPKKTANYESLVALQGQTAMEGRAPHDGPLRLRLRAVFPVPQSWSKNKKRQALVGALRPGRPDIDNVVKSITDGLQGVAYIDDKQIAEIAAVKHYGMTPGAWVTVEPITSPVMHDGGPACST